MKREQVAVDSKANVLQRRFSEADYARLGRVQGGVDIRLFLKTRSCAALRAADLDWIVGPEYSLGGYIFGDSQLLRRRSL